MNDITYSPKQEEAIDRIVEWFDLPVEENQIYYLAGFAGTGKSTIVEEAKRRIQEAYGVNNMPTGAFTGKAAFVLRKKGNASAQTIHSMIYTPKSRTDEEIEGIRKAQAQGMKIAESEAHFTINPLGAAARADLIILDECSMIPEDMAKDLLSFGKKILVMGDPGQLPPVSGEGFFTARQPDFFLQEIHRQAADSPIIELATWARRGERLPIGYNKAGVRVLALTNATAEELHNPETQVICGVNRIRWAVTGIIRDRLGFTGEIPAHGERILCCKNNNEIGLFNGGLGTLHSIEKVEKYDSKVDAMALDGLKITADIEGAYYRNLMVDPYLFRQHFTAGAAQKNYKKKLNEFDFGYVLTCHKSQGSQFKHATVIDDSDSFRENKWKWLYTAITRAEEGLTLLVK